ASATCSRSSRARSRSAICARVPSAATSPCSRGCAARSGERRAPPGTSSATLLIRLAVRASAGAAEQVLAAILELAPGGVEQVDGPGYVEFALYGAPGE